MTTEIEYLSASEVATKLNLNYETVRRWLQSKKLKAYKAGKQWRIKQVDLDNYLRIK